jgi:hypothetical protein
VADASVSMVGTSHLQSKQEAGDDGPDSKEAKQAAICKDQQVREWAELTSFSHCL